MELKAMSRRLRIYAVTCLAALTLTASEHHGLVKFGAVPVPGVTVTATKDAKKVVAVTDDTGAYYFPDLEDGVWKLSVEMLAFDTVSKDIGVTAGAPAAEWDIKLQSLDQIKPTQQAAPPAPPPGTAAPATASGTGTPAPAATQQAAATPKPGAAAPAANAKGKKGAAPAPTQPGFQRTDVNASGDTAPAGGAASPATPSIAEAQSASDAMVVNGSTSNGIERRAIGNGRKGPRSLFNGGIDFRNFANDNLNARSYDTLGVDTPRSPYNQYTAGASLQGPLWVPHLFRFQGNFSLSYQTTRIRNASNTAFTMPTLAEQQGNFAGFAPIIDPTTPAPFPNHHIPTTRISPQAQYFLNPNFFPLPQIANSSLNYNFQEPLISRSVQDQLMARANHSINNKSSINGLFAMQKNSNDNENVLSWLDTTKISGYHGTFTYNRNFSRTWISQFKADYTRYSVLTTPFFANKTNVSGDAGILGNEQNPLNYGPPSMSFGASGIAGISDGNENFIRNQTSWLGGIITYIRRPHQFQFGGDFKVQDLSTVGQSNGRGSFGFTGNATAGCAKNPLNCPAGVTQASAAANCATNPALCSTGFDFADFLLGTPDVITLANGNPDKYLHSNIYDLFINDNWNVNSSFTLQWGVRWDYSSPFTEKYGRLANLDITQGWTAAQPVTAINPRGPLTGSNYADSLINPDKHQFSPRLSFAWRPIFGSSMVVRGNYGVYFNTSIYQGIANLMAAQAPFARSLNLTNPTGALTLANAFTGASGSGADTFAVDPSLRVGYAQIYGASVQQNVTASLLVTVTYAGIRGTRNLQEFQPNTLAPGAIGTACTSCYTYLTSNGNSTRNAGSIALRRRFHGGVSTNFTYTYAKAMDDSGSLLNYGGQGAGSPLGAVAQNWQNLAGERGPSNSDQRHNFNAQLQYSTGVGVHGGALLGGWRGVIIKGWTIQSNITVGSGNPFTPIYYSPLLGSGQSVVRPEYLGGNVYGGAGGLFLNPTAFGAPPAGQFGDVGRNSLYGPNQFAMGGSMARSFVDKYTVTVAATNVLNHPTYGSVYSTFDPILGSSGQTNYGRFGQLNPPGGMRAITATFRWTF